jgi:hypothetical protein
MLAEDYRGRKIYEQLVLSGLRHRTTRIFMISKCPGAGPSLRAGGEIIVANAKEFCGSSSQNSRNASHSMPDEKEKRHGQAIAAASLARIA